MNQAIDITLRMKDQATRPIAAALSGIQRQTQAVASALSGLASLGAGAAVAAFFRGAVREAVEAERNTRKLEAVLRSTGDAAGLSAKAMLDLAGALETTTGVEADLIVNAEAVLATFTRVGRQAFPEAVKAALDLSAVMGQDLQSSIVQIGKALNDPINGMTALRRVGVSFSEDQAEQIKQWVQHGDLLSAQKAILAELTTEFGNAAAAMQGPLSKSISTVTLAWKNFLQAVGESQAVQGSFTWIAEQVNKVAEAMGRISRWQEELPYRKKILSTGGPSALFAYDAAVQAGMPLASVSDPMVNALAAGVRAGLEPALRARSPAMTVAGGKGGAAARAPADTWWTLGPDKWADETRSLKLYDDSVVKAAEDVRALAAAREEAAARLEESWQRYRALAGSDVLPTTSPADQVAAGLVNQESPQARDRRLANERMQALIDAQRPTAGPGTGNDFEMGPPTAGEYWQRQLDQATTYYDAVRAMGQLWAEEHVATVQDAARLTAEIVNQAVEGISAAFAQAIVYGKSLGEALAGVLKSIAAFVIQTLVKLGLEAVLSALIAKTAELGKMVAAASANAAIAATAGAAHGASKGGYLGAVAEGAATGAAAIAAGTAAFGAATAAFGGLAAGMLAGAAHGGLGYVPREQTMLLDRGERVLSPAQNRDLTEFLDGEGSRPQVVEVKVQLGERTLGKALVDLAAAGRAQSGRYRLALARA